MRTFLDRLLEFEPFAQAWEIWLSGGWAMIALAINGFLLFYIGTSLWLKFKARGWRKTPEAKWRRWIAEPALRKGPLGEIISFVMATDDLDGVSVRFNELQTAEIAPYSRDLRFMKRAVSTAPLLGLLGTVTGMLATFGALSAGSGGDKTMDLLSQGISEALITTETGLVIALPGLFFQYHLARERDRYQTFLARLQTQCAQFLCLQRKREAAPSRSSS